MEVLLHVDGTSDACSQGKDINFTFKGFGITGRVNYKHVMYVVTCFRNYLRVSQKSML